MSRERKEYVSSQVEDELASKFSSVNQVADVSQADLVAMADAFGRALAKNVRLKTTQVRKFFEAVKRVAAQLRTQESVDLAGECAMLRPLLAYMAGRIDTVRPLMKVLDPCLQKIRTPADFRAFYAFLESTLAYHRYYGGRDY